MSSRRDSRAESLRDAALGPRREAVERLARSLGLGVQGVRSVTLSLDGDGRLTMLVSRDVSLGDFDVVNWEAVAEAAEGLSPYLTTEEGDVTRRTTGESEEVDRG